MPNQLNATQHYSEVSNYLTVTHLMESHSTTKRVVLSLSIWRISIKY